MDPRYFFVESKVFLAVDQNCSIIEFDTIEQASAINPICILRAKSSFENVTYNGFKQQWYRGAEYILFSSSGSEAEKISIANWYIKDIYILQDGNTIKYNLIDPLGKITSYSVENKIFNQTITYIFTKTRYISTFESMSNYKLQEENNRLKQRINELINSNTP